MAQFDFFALPAEWFSALRAVPSVSVYGQRYLDSGRPPGIFKLNNISPEEYAAEGFREVLVTSGEAPRNDTDWNFIDRCEAEIITVERGRLKERQLEMATMRTIAKKSSAHPAFRSIKRDILARGGKYGYLHPSGTLYERIFVTSAAANYSLVFW